MSVTLVCDIDGCAYELDSQGRGFMRMGLHRKNAHGLAAGTAPPPLRIEPGGEGHGARGEPVTASAVAPHETAPPSRPGSEPETAPARKKGPRSWFKGKTKQRGAPTNERAPRAAKAPRGRRIPLDTDISDAWAFMGRRLENTAHYPTGRMLQYQAPGAGVILDKAVAGTRLDRLALQPLARNRDKYEDAAYLLAGPLVTLAITRSYQELAVAMQEGDGEKAEALRRRLQMQFEGFDWLIASMLPRLAEGKKLAQEKKEKEEAVIADAFPELVGTGVSPSEALRDMLFAPPSFAQGGPDVRESGDPAQNGRGPDPMAGRTDVSAGPRHAPQG